MARSAPRYSKAEYKKVREALKAVQETASFEYCPADQSLIWHSATEPLQEDGGYAHFLKLASELHGPEIGSLVLGYFKNYCVSSHITPEMKAKRLEHLVFRFSER